MAPRFFFGPARWLQPDSGLTSTERLVLAVLCQWTNKDTGECFPSIATVAAHAALCENSVRKAVAGLVAHKAIVVRQRWDEKGVPMSSVYLILGYDPPASGEGGVPQPVKGGTSRRGGRIPQRVNLNVVSTNTPVNKDGFALETRTDADGTIWLGNTPYRDRSKP